MNERTYLLTFALLVVFAEMTGCNPPPAARSRSSKGPPSPPPPPGTPAGVQSALLSSPPTTPGASSTSTANLPAARRSLPSLSDQSYRSAYPSLGQRVMYTPDNEKWFLAEVAKIERDPLFIVRILGLPDDMTEPMCPPTRLWAIDGETSVANLPADTLEQIEVETKDGWVIATVLARALGRCQVHFNTYPDSENEVVAEERTRKLAMFNVAPTEKFPPRLCCVKDRMMFGLASRKREGKYLILFFSQNSYKRWLSEDKVAFEPRDEKEATFFGIAERAIAGKPRVRDPVWFREDRSWEVYSVYAIENEIYQIHHQQFSAPDGVRRETVAEADLITAIPYTDQDGKRRYASLHPNERTGGEIAPR